MYNSLQLLLTTLSSSTSTDSSSTTQMIVLMVVLVVVMYFLMIRPQKKRQKEEEEMKASLEIGDEIITIGGIVGRIVTIREDDIVIETGADRTKMKIQRWAVNTNKTKLEQHQKETEAAKEAAKEKKESKKRRGKKNLKENNEAPAENNEETK